MSKQADRRKLARLKAEFYASPWAIDARVLGMLAAAIEEGDIEDVSAALTLGGECESTTKIVNGIAIIPITGVLRDEVDYMVRWFGCASYQLIERDFNQAMANDAVRGVLFYVNSPGGSAIGCKRVADLVFESRGDKPIRAFVQGVCASAAFYIASATDRMESTADSLVGSVGTIMPHLEISGMLKEIGYGATVFTNAESPKKGHGNIYEPLSDAAKATLQNFVNSYGTPFVNDVARYRGVKAEDVVARYGQGDAMRADIAIKQGVVDAVVENFQESLDSITRAAGNGPATKAANTPVVSGATPRRNVMNERIKAQLFALGLIDSLDASDAECKVALRAWFKSRGVDSPSDEAQVLASLQAAAPVRSQSTPGPTNGGNATSQPPANSGSPSGESAEAYEARLEDLSATASILNAQHGREVASMAEVHDACKRRLSAAKFVKEIAAKLAPDEPPVSKPDVTGEGADRFAADAVDAQAYRAGSSATISADAKKLANQPLWAVACKCLQMAGHKIDLYADREYIAEMAMSMGTPGVRHSFYSTNENERYIQASGGPAARPGDFPNILSALARKYLDTIELDDDFSYPEISAMLPGGLNDFKPAPMINKGIVEELDEVSDAEKIKELGLNEEVLSYIFLRRFANKWGWTPVLVANDDMNAFAEGMLGLEEAWRVTQNRLVLDRYTSSETLLDGSALFANRADIGSATNDNNLASGGSTPSDAQWGLMEAKYADISGIATGRRVRGALNVALVPSGIPYQEARRTFMPLNAGGLEPKQADTTANVGIYRNMVKVVPESELRATSVLEWYGLRSPTKLNTATVVRGYFNGYGESGRRERWYDPERKTTWVSIEGRIAVAVKNWRYAIKNKGAA